MRRNIQHWLIPGSRGVTPLHDAAKNGQLDIVPKELLNSDALLETTEDGSTVIHYAAEYGNLGQLPIDRLIGPSGKSAFKRAFSLLRTSTTPENKQTMLGPRLTNEEKRQNSRNLLRSIPNAISVLNAQSNMLIPNKRGSTPLHKAADNGFLSQTPETLLSEANMNLPNNNGTTVIQLAFRSKSAYQLPPSLINPTTMCRKDEDGYTAFHFAAEAGTLDAIPVDLLTEENLLTPNKAGVTPMHKASYYLHISQIPKHILTTETLLTIDKQGRTVLESLAENVKDDLSQLDTILGMELPESTKKIVGEKWWDINEEIKIKLQVEGNKNQLFEDQDPTTVELF